MVSFYKTEPLFVDRSRPTRPVVAHGYPEITKYQQIYCYLFILVEVVVAVAVTVLNHHHPLAAVSQNLTRLYLDKATLVWNGNAVSGQDALGEFFESLPSSEFQVQTLDCQPVHG